MEGRRSGGTHVLHDDSRTSEPDDRSQRHQNRKEENQAKKTDETENEIGQPLLFWGTIKNSAYIVKYNNLCTVASSSSLTCSIYLKYN